MIFLKKQIQANESIFFSIERKEISLTIIFVNRIASLSIFLEISSISLEVKS